MPVKKPRDASRIAHMRWMGSRLRRAREEKGLTQSEVAKKLGFAQSWLANIEKAENGLDAIDLQRLSDLYGVPTSYFTDPQFLAHIRRPRNRLEWLALFDGDEARARAHDAIEEPFRMRDSDQQGPDQRQAG